MPTPTAVGVPTGVWVQLNVVAGLVATLAEAAASNATLPTPLAAFGDCPAPVQVMQA